jgi:hypothetical protein
MTSAAYQELIVYCNIQIGTEGHADDTELLRRFLTHTPKWAWPENLTGPGPPIQMGTPYSADSRWLHRTRKSVSAISFGGYKDET